MTNKYTVAVVGAGSIYQAHMNGYNINDKDISVEAVVDPVENARKIFMDQYDIKKSYSSMEELFQDFIPDIVSICTWHALHHEQTIEAAKAGVKAIICEKPMSIGSGPAQSMLDECKENNV